MIFITGDTHGSYSRIVRFCAEKNCINKKDVMIVLGDTGLNYYGDERDVKKKNKISANVPLTLFFIHGNHDLRPQNLKSYYQKTWNGGVVFYEEAYPNLLFAKDGEIFTLEDKKTLVIGGAYSIDKQFRLQNKYLWFADEQPSEQIKAFTEQQLQKSDWKIDTVLSHTCPLKYQPKEAFFTTVNQNEVDISTEEWLDNLENRLTYQRWFCGHFHIDKKIDKIQFLFKDIVPF